MSIDEHTDVRICENCRVVTVLDEASGQWIHPPELRRKFDRSVCAEARPGRVARDREARFGMGRPASKDKFDLHGTVAELGQPPDTPLTVGVDGSYKLTTSGATVRKPMSWAFVATNGQYGLGTATRNGRMVGDDRVLQGELRAIWWAVSRIPRSHPITVLTDSMDAVELAAQWRLGLLTMPRGYTLDRPSGREATLLQLARLVAGAGDRITVDWVRGHSGHPLNEGADALAKIGRAWASRRLTREVVAADARRIVLSALTGYAALL